jgi:large subunit ribosomal protein L6
MSRIGKQIIPLPSNTVIEQDGSTLTVKGVKGALTLTIPEGIHVEVADNTAVLTRENDSFRAAHGLMRALLANAVTGVSSGWQKTLEMQGVGMRAALSGDTLTLNVGFSHPVMYKAPEGVTLSVVKNTISVSGIDRQLVGEVAANIRKVKEPEPYKGKGIRYTDEYVRRKAGKTGKAGK